MTDCTKITEKELGLGERIQGALVGFCVGDAMGITEFMEPDEIKRKFGTVREMIGGGWLNLKPGETTDDTAMMLAVARSLVSTSGIPDYKDMAERLLVWLDTNPRDVGMACRRGLESYRATGRLHHGDDETLGNGGLLRILGFVLAGRNWQEGMEHVALTHNASLQLRRIQSYFRMTDAALRGEDRAEIRSQLKGVSGGIRRIENGGDVINTLRSAVTHFYLTESFEECIISAINAGRDADSVAAIAGSIAGAHYGINAIPGRWSEILDPLIKAECMELAVKFCLLRGDC